jgi:hypothetical protein
MADTVKTIGYSLYENFMRNEEDGLSYYAKVKSRGFVTRNDIIDMIVERNTTVTRQEIASVLEHLEEVVKSNLKMGFTVQTGLFTVSVGIRGSFDALDDEFDPLRHKAVINVRTSPSLKKLAATGLTLEKGKPTLPNPSVIKLFDYKTRTTNLRLTPGSVASVSGSKLRIDTEDENQGIFFINEENPEGIKVEDIVFSTDGKLVFNVPENMENGEYMVTVKCGFGEDLRTSTMKSSVTVGEEVTA